jgi:hydroxypyruvate isomerase
MIALSGCAEALFTDLPFVDRIDAIAKLGIPAFEFWTVGGKDLDAIADAQQRAGLAVSSIVCETGGPIVDESNRGGIKDAVAGSIAAAKKLSCTTMIVTVGQELEGVSRAAQHKSIVDGLRIATSHLEDAGMTIVVEPLNTLVNHQGYYLATTAEGVEIVGEVASPNVKLLYDVYHQQITEGNLIDTIHANIDDIGHFHMADVPGRHEPGTGEINYENVFAAIAETSYSGYIGLELWPTKPEAEALGPVIGWASQIFAVEPD